jgi:hypothetical protein
MPFRSLSLSPLPFSRPLPSFIPFTYFEITSHPSGEVLNIPTTHIYRSLHCNKSSFPGSNFKQGGLLNQYFRGRARKKFEKGDLI